MQPSFLVPQGPKTEAAESQASFFGPEGPNLHTQGRFWHFSAKTCGIWRSQIPNLLYIPHFWPKMGQKWAWNWALLGPNFPTQGTFWNFCLGKNFKIENFQKFWKFWKFSIGPTGNGLKKSVDFLKAVASRAQWNFWIFLGSYPGKFKNFPFLEFWRSQNSKTSLPAEKRPKFWTFFGPPKIGQKLADFWPNFWLRNLALRAKFPRPPFYNTFWPILGQKCPNWAHFGPILHTQGRFWQLRWQNLWNLRSKFPRPAFYIPFWAQFAYPRQVLVLKRPKPVNLAKPNSQTYLLYPILGPFWAQNGSWNWAILGPISHLKAGSDFFRNQNLRIWR